MRRVAVVKRGISCQTYERMEIARTNGCYDSILKLLAIATGANETSIWIPSDDGQCLVMEHNPSWPAGAERKPSQPIGDGLVSEVYRTGEPMEDTGMYKSPVASDRVDKAFLQKTVAMMASPIWNGNTVAGVLVIVQIINERKRPGEWGFRRESSEMLELAARVIESMA